jgi:hypothetical protein
MAYTCRFVDLKQILELKHPDVFPSHYIQTRNIHLLVIGLDPVNSQYRSINHCLGGCNTNQSLETLAEHN